jgi:NADPH:quinone reductase-like Zn-dependent oxidoreductase
LKAITFNRHGDSDVLEYADVPTPRPGAGEALVAVRAVSVNHGPDIETRRYGFAMGEQPMPHIGGVDPAGEIVQVGPGVSGFAIGDRVAVYPVIACGVCDFCTAGAGENYCRNSLLFGVQTPGGRAEYATVPTTQLVRLPDGVSFEAAAALGVAYTTTWHGLIDRAQMTGEDTLLVMGAGGGCGVAAVQIAKWLGARVIAVTGPGWKQERLQAIGADVVLSYQDDDWPQRVREATDGRGVTVAFDNAGTATLPASIQCLARAGKLVCSGGTSGLEATINIRHLYRNHISLLFYVQGTKADMEKLVGLVASGELDPVIDREYPLHDAGAADDHLDARDQFGRVVLVIETTPADNDRKAARQDSLVAGDRRSVSID